MNTSRPTHLSRPHLKALPQQLQQLALARAAQQRQRGCPPRRLACPLCIRLLRGLLSAAACCLCHTCSGISRLPNRLLLLVPDALQAHCQCGKPVELEVFIGGALLGPAGNG